MVSGDDMVSGDQGGDQRGDQGGGLVWYMSYGSNMHPDRLAYYLAGGRPPGAARTYPGSRDRRLPAASVPLEMPGALYFATESPVWTGGRAFYDPTRPDTRVFARAHLVTVEQFSDIAAQEMYRIPGPDLDLDLTVAVREGRAELGEGRYETIVCPGTLDGLPVLTFTAPWTMDAVVWKKPSATYLRYLCAGLLGTGTWDLVTIAAYLAAAPGAAGHWTAQEVMDLM